MTTTPTAGPTPHEGFALGPADSPDAGGAPVPLVLGGSRRATIRLHADDDVVIACYPLSAGDHLDAEGVTVRGDVPAGHKVATRAMAAGVPVHRYGQVIGTTSGPVEVGDHVHTHNLEMSEFARDPAPSVDSRPTRYADEVRTFDGIRRADGRAATRNYVGIVSSVNCSATVVRAIAEAFRRTSDDPGRLAGFPNVDGVVPLVHETGCAVDPAGEGFAVLRRTLRGYAEHANFGGIVMIGLGCETNQVDEIPMGEPDGPLLARFTIQDVGGTTRAIAQGIALVESMLPAVNDVRREPVPLSELTVGLQCGGSDGYSGITANPALGHAVDLLVRQGGTAILSETPEIYGAEHLLTRRARTPEVADKLLRRFDWWLAYAERMGAELNNNPSAGNKAGGLTTVLEKSLGGVTKAGTTDLVDVYTYAERVTEHGLVFMDTPGFDPVSATGQVAGGANLICFTTGRGSAYGCQPTPSLKIATNTVLWDRQRDDMDLDAGPIVGGRRTIADVGDEIFEAMIECASGRRSRSELHGYGQNEFAPWQLSAVM